MARPAFLMRVHRVPPRWLYLGLLATSAFAAVVIGRRLVGAVRIHPLVLAGGPGLIVAGCALVVWILTALFTVALIDDPRVRTASLASYPLLFVAPPIGYWLALLAPALPARAQRAVARSRTGTVALVAFASAGLVWVDMAAPRFSSATRLALGATLVGGIVATWSRTPRRRRLAVLAVVVGAGAWDAADLNLAVPLALAWVVSGVLVNAPAILLHRSGSSPAERTALGALPASALALLHLFGWYGLPSRPLPRTDGIAEIYRATARLGAFDNRFMIEGLERGTFLVGTKERPHALSLLDPPGGSRVVAEGQTGDNAWIDRENGLVTIPFYVPSGVCRWWGIDPPTCVRPGTDHGEPPPALHGFSVVRGSGHHAYTVGDTRWLCAVETERLRCAPSFDVTVTDLAVTTEAVWASGGGVLFRCAFDGPCARFQVFSMPRFAASDFARDYLATDGRRLWMTDNLTGDVAEIAVSEPRVTRTIHLGRGIRNLAFDPRHRLLWVANEVTGSLHALDSESLGISRTFELGRRLRWPELDADGARLLVTSAAGGFAIDIERVIPR